MYLSSPGFSFIFFFHSSGHHRDLHSFPTRRSSDLALLQIAACRWNDNVAKLYERVGCRVWRRCHSDRKSTRLNSSHVSISYAVFCLKKKKKQKKHYETLNTTLVKNNGHHLVCDTHT